MAMIEALAYYFSNLSMGFGNFIWQTFAILLSISLTQKANMIIFLNILMMLFLIFFGVKELIPLAFLLFFYFAYDTYFRGTK